MSRLSALVVMIVAAAPVLAWGDPLPPPGWYEGVTVKELGTGNRGRVLAFTPDGTTVLTPELARVEAATGRVVLPDTDRAGRLLGFDRAGHVLAWRPVRPQPTRAPDGVEVFDATADRVVCRVGTGEVTEIAISPDLATVAVSSGDKVGVWDAKTGKPLGALETPAGAIRYYVHALAFSPDGKFLAAGSGTSYPVGGQQNGAVAVWDVATRRLRHALPSPESQVNALAWSPDGTRLARGGIHSTGLRVWDVATSQEALLRYRGAGQFFDVAFSPDGKTVTANWRARGAGATDAGVVLWDAATGRGLGALSGNVEVVRAVAFSPDGRRLAALDNRGTLRVWQRIPHGYEVAAVFVPPGAVLESHLEAVLGKDAARRVRRFGPPGRMLLSRFEWAPEGLKPGERVRVYFPVVASPKVVTVRAGGKDVWRAAGTADVLSDPIEVPAGGLTVRVWYAEEGSYVPEGVSNVYVLRAKE